MHYKMFHRTVIKSSSLSVTSHDTEDTNKDLGPAVKASIFRVSNSANVPQPYTSSLSVWDAVRPLGFGIINQSNTLVIEAVIYATSVTNIPQFQPPASRPSAVKHAAFDGFSGQTEFWFCATDVYIPITLSISDTIYWVKPKDIIKGWPTCTVQGIAASPL
jgi:hypothetical protein